MNCCAAILCLTAMLLLAVLSERHYQPRLGRPRAPRPVARGRTVAWGLLAAGFAAAVAARGWVFGPIAWVGWTMAAAAASCLLVNLLPARVRRR